MLVLRLLRHRWRQSVTLAGVTAVLTLLLITSATSASMVHASQVDSVISGFAGYPYITQAQNPSDSEALARVDGAVAVTTMPATASHAGLALPVDQREHAAPGASAGRLLEGLTPQRPGEATISISVANSLGLTAGQRIVLTLPESNTSRTVKITGVSVDPGARASAFVDVLTPIQPAEATSWLMARDPFEDQSLAQRFQDRTITGRTTEVLAQDTAGTGPTAQIVAAAGRGDRALLATSVLLLATLLVLMARSCRQSVLALEAAGMPRTSGWAVVVRAGALVLAASTLAGSVVGLAAVWLFRSPLAAAFGQYWTTPTLPVGWLVAVPVVFVALTPALAIVVALRGASVVSTAPPTLTALGPRISAGLVVVGVVGWIALATFPQNLLWAVAASVPVITGSYFLTTSLIASHQSSSIRALARRGAAQLLPLTGVIVLVGIGCSAFAALQMTNTELMRVSSPPNQPPGSIAVLSVDDRTRQELSRQFKNLGGGAVQWYSIPDERTKQLRVTNPGLIQCSREDPTANVDTLLGKCGPQNNTRSPTNYVVLAGGTPPTGGASAAPALVESDRIGLLQYATGTDQIVATEIIKASTDDRLGENLPGAVMALDSATASKFNLVPSGQELLVALGFADMDQSDQLRFRGTLTALAPTAQIAEGIIFDTSAANRTANLVAGAGAGAVIALATAGALAWSSSQASLRHTFAELGVSTRARTLLTLRLCAPAIAAGIATVASAVTIAWFFGDHSLVPGWWPLPAIAAVLAPVVMIAAHVRTPSSQR